MASHMQDEDFNSSIAADSVFDWGFRRERRDSTGESVKEADDSSKKSSVGGGPSSRYDPKAMSRIVDITDLVDDSDDADSDFDEDVVGGSANISAKNRAARAAKKKRRPSESRSYSSPLLCRQVVILVALVGIIAGAAVAIGYAIINSDNPDAARPSRLGEGNQEARQQQSGEAAQGLMKMSQRVIEACSESALDADMTECQRLCKGTACCFEDDYSCEDDAEKDCAVHAGCVALIEGELTDAAEEDEE